MKKYTFHIITIFLSLLILISCKETKNDVVQSNKTSSTKAGYEIEPVNIQNVKLSDSFWLPISYNCVRDSEM